MSTTSPTANFENDLQGLLLRVNALEKEVAQIKEKTTDEPASKSDRARRWESICGSMKDDPEFAEVLRLGREFRKSYFTE